MCNRWWGTHYITMRQTIQFIFVFLCMSIWGQKEHYTSDPIMWNGEFSDEYSLCVMNRRYELTALGNLKYDVPHGKWLYLARDSVVKQMGEYKNGLRHGFWINYDEHGNVQSSGKYKKGKLHGEWTFYDIIRIYKNGERIK